MAKDTASPELPKNIRAKGNGYELRMARKGYPEISRMFDTLDEAEAERSRIILHIKDGKAPPNVTARKFSVDNAITEYIKRHPSMGKSKLHDLGRVSKDLGGVKILSLNYGGIGLYLELKLTEKVQPPVNKKKKGHHRLYDGKNIANRTLKPSTVRKYYFALKTAVEWHARTHGYSLPEHLFDGHKLPSAWEQERERRLEDGEEERLMDVCARKRADPLAWQRLIRFALETAMRLQEILKIEWRDVHETGRYIHLREEIVKTRTERQVPLSKVALALLDAQRATKHPDDPRVFWQWTQSSTVTHAFRRISHNAECKDLRFHDLRHEAISRLFERTSLGMMEIASMTGHTDLKTLKRYTRLRPHLLAEKLDTPPSRSPLNSVS